ncbi:outer membrane protein assembly factor BamA [Antarcticibacterium flavum]|uniref:Outer membrane protein assembly factor BamA n=1 Tax=Antarcticibacterium flavum TaxID=2058175 RepID=A0A5B7X3R8_9FLAO|nr:MULTISPECIES: outer membrane protein assembly factor BamA [Antarcticibacterium]MCM4158385.1 outer membrane protein assembly factor BamA [Antarcticibacterium sp. W02-3]QCY70146.1 outer membrane protein assembly factor BamA [Antarcticibacterium flavum]
MTKRIIFLLAFCLISNISTQAQDLPLGQGKKYTIGSITVTGAESYNEQTIIAYSGLSKGEEIFIPGDRLSKVLKKLWDSNLFSDINFYITNVEGDVAHLELEITEVPELAEVRIQGISKKRQTEELIKENNLTPGVKVTENLTTTTKNYIENKYKKDGYLNAKVVVSTSPAVDTTGANKVNMVVNVDRGDKVKISNIEFNGNEQLSNARLRRALKNTKQKNFFRFWKRSKFIASDYEEDKTNLINKYKEKGFRDARILSDTLIRKDNDNIAIRINLEEGNRYYIGDIEFIGNTVYTDEQLGRALGISKGDIYNGVLLKERIADPSDPDAADLANLYKNNGYLFSQINPVETRVYNDTIDFEIRIMEGKEAYFNNISVVGNDKTKDHVIYRELRTKPGQKYSQQNVIRTLREVGQLGFFDAEQISPDFQNVDPNSGTLDMQYSVVEAGASQIELQGGYGGGGFIGTLGLSFNNFSLSGIFDKEAYKPLPMGDGQTLSLRAQASIFYQTYSLNFVEPWFGGQRPVSLSTSFSYTRQFFFDQRRRRADKSRSFDILGVNVGLAKRLRWPDDYFTLSQAVGFQRYDLNNYNTGLFTFGDGFSNNLTYTLGITRNSEGINPIFPTTGSNFSLTAKFTPPYSLWNGVDYANLDQQREFQLEDADGNLLNADGLRLRPGDEPVGDRGKIDQEKFKWLEFYKIKFKGSWFNTLYNFGGNSNLVLRTHAEFGFLGAYNNDRGIPPFERFFLGGDGLGAFSLDGREVIALRGYPNQQVVPMDRSTISQASNNDGATLYNKYSLELRFPITLKPMASIYALTFLEAGATYDNFRDYNPFLLNRSAGAGIRIFMPQFGLLGIDFGYGFDPIPGSNAGPNGWETHFIIGQQF